MRATGPRVGSLVPGPRAECRSLSLPAVLARRGRPKAPRESPQARERQSRRPFSVPLGLAAHGRRAKLQPGFQQAGRLDAALLVPPHFLFREVASKCVLIA